MSGDDLRPDVFVTPTYVVSQLGNARGMARLAARHGFKPVVVCNSNETAAALADNPFSLSVGKNTGYGGAANLVAGRLDFRTIVVCNDDLVFSDAAMGALHASVVRLGLGGNAQIMGFLPEARPRIATMPGVPAVLGLVSGMSALTRRVAEHRAGALLPARAASAGDDPALLRGDLGFPFVCVAVTRRAWDELGGFDPRFPLYFEDMDLLARARRAGVQVRVATGECTHASSASSRTAVPYIVPLMSVGARNYLQLHRRVPRVIASFLVSQALALRAMCWLPFRSHRVSELSAVLRAIGAVWSPEDAPMPPW